MLARHNGDSSFGVFPIAFHALDNEDPLRDRDFVNDLREELLVGCSDECRDRVLTELSNRVGSHARRFGGAGPEGGGLGSGPVKRPAQPPSPPVAVTVDPGAGVGLRPGLHGVAELPADFVAPAELGELVEQVRTGPVTGITAVRGEGGTGKSVLAAAVARRLELEFPGGVHWATVGAAATPEDVRRAQIELLHSLGADVIREPRNFSEGRDALRAALVERAALVVVDDVWETWHGRAFDIAGGGSRVLFTTRFADALPVSAQLGTRELGRLDSRSAYGFLRDLPAGLPPAGEDLLAVVEAAGGLRLALSVLSATAHIEGSWSPVVARLDGLARRFGSGDEASAAHKAAHVATDTLDPDDRDRLMLLASFPPDAVVPVSVLGWLWDLDDEQAQRTIRRFEAKQLLVGRGGALEVHDHVHDYLVIAAPPSDVHQRLWALGVDRSAGGWPNLADTMPYVWDG